MKEIVDSYRLSATGTWGYAFHHRGRAVARATSTLGPVSTVQIQGPTLHWVSSFNIDTPIVPGMSRRVRDAASGEELYRIIYLQPGLYQFLAWIDHDYGSIYAEEKNGVYLFGRQGLPVMAMTEHTGARAWLPGTASAAPCFRTIFFDGIPSVQVALLVLSFPALRFY